MSHPNPHHDSENVYPEDNMSHTSGTARSKMPSKVHSSPEFKELRKTFQGINATKKGSIEKSKHRNSAKLKALEAKMK